MKKYLIIIVVTFFVFFILLSGCTQENNNNVITDEIKLISYNIETDPSTGVREVTGSLKNIGNRTINPVVVEVFFHNNDNVIIFSGTYTIYNFVNGSTEYFFVQYRPTDPNYQDYDHYSIKLKYD